MPKNDVVVRSAADLERKYNFALLFGLKKNVELTAQGIKKIENELNSMLNALVINLKDVLDSQGEISLWFYSGKPTISNEPYTSWTDPDEHIGDIYYDQSSGTVYQWNNVWEVNTSPDLIEAMAITNAETDTTTDHERKVFFDTPYTPYSNGDWWIKDDGSLFICQISKTDGTYDEADFIDNNNYTESIAEKIGEELKVIKGTITIISENYAKFTDLATGGSTTINGDNITTGNIKSENYVENVSGTKINLTDGAIDTKDFKVDSKGKIKGTAGIIGGFTISDNQLYADIIAKADYTETDVQTIYDYYLETITLTDEELERLDANNDGVVDLYDAVVITNFIQNNISKSHPGRIEINANNGGYNIVIKDGLGNTKTTLGLGGITTPKINCGTMGDITAKIQELEDRIKALEG